MSQSKKKAKIPLMYLCIFNQMTRKYGKKDRVLSYQSILEVWHRHVYNVPKKYFTHFIEEMCEFGLLERVSTESRIIHYKFFGYTRRNCLDVLSEFFLW